MPNEVYEMTHTALSALVSHRAATRVLDVALHAGGTDADTVTVRAMRRLLAGRVRRELSGSLPSSGLTRSLRRIADDLYRLQPSHTTIVEIISPEERAETERLLELASARTAPLEGRSGSTRQAGGTAVAGPGVAAKPKPLPITNQAGLAPAVAPKPPPTTAPAHLDTPLVLSETVMMAALRLFGELEPVEQVVVVRGSEVLLERGSGAPTERLPNLVRSTRHLLARAGRLKLYALERAEGMLFVFPVGDGAIVVLTQPSVNIGAVLSARAALEEAA